MSTLLNDLKYALRGLRQSPAFTAAAVVTLGLGIGANTAIFSVVNAVLLRPMPLPDADRLVLLLERKLPDFPSFSVSVANYLDYRAQNRVLTDVGAYNLTDLTVTGGREAESIPGAEITASLFPVLTVEPVLGRRFVDGDTQPGPDHVTIISQGLWLRRFGGDSQCAEGGAGREVCAAGRRARV